MSKNDSRHEDIESLASVGALVNGLPHEGEEEYDRRKRALKRQFGKLSSRELRAKRRKIGIQLLSDLLSLDAEGQKKLKRLSTERLRAKSKKIAEKTLAQLEEPAHEHASI
ncbi:MAG: hypothetical protein HY457_02520 [Parcubacteria group bacterium]|nr:hypothetical protein [Parcubacteria group bacterium]